jgi:hypothetical protein
MVAEAVGEMSLDTQQLAWLVLQTVNRTQAKGTTIRLVVPSDPEVVRQLDPTLAEHELLAAEAYLLEKGYLAPTNLDLTWGTYSITLAGLEWLKGGLTDKEAAFDWTLRAELEEERSLMEEIERELDEESSGAPESAGEGQERAEARAAATAGFQTATERRSWWKRVFGG